MTPNFIGSIIAVAAAAAFFAARGSLRWWLPCAMALFVMVGGGGIWLLEKGPQKAFSWMPISVTHQAWTFNVLVVTGIGGLAGCFVRSGLALARRPGPPAEPSDSSGA